MQCLDKFTDFYESYKLVDLDSLDAVYAPDAVFTDPIQTVHGLAAIKEHLKKTSAGLNACEFDIEVYRTGDDRAFAQWLMSYSHPKLRQGESLTLEGCSSLRIDPKAERIIYHKDYYDMGEMLYEHVPLLGSVVKAIKNRLR